MTLTAKDANFQFFIKLFIYLGLERQTSQRPRNIPTEPYLILLWALKPHSLDACMSFCLFICLFCLREDI